MRYVIAAAVLVLVGFAAVCGHEAQGAAGEDAGVRFVPLHVFIDSGETGLAAWQFELKASGDVKIVGIEGGEHEAFAEPAHYDPAALMNNRIIIAAFSMAGELPTGKTRVASIHLQITGDAEPGYELVPAVAGDRGGKEIAVTITGSFGEGK